MYHRQKELALVQNYATFASRGIFIPRLQEAEAEQHEAAKQAKAAARRAALEAAAAQRAEEARKRHEFMQETKKVSCLE